jgi:hypothetical protein
MNPQLIEQINLELDSMSIIVSDVESLVKEVGNSTPTNIHKTALGGFASQFYNGVENILKRIHKNFNIELPIGDNWHLVLLFRFSNNSDFDLPIKFNVDLIDKLSNYRRFRHYFFHGYSHNLNWSILLSGVNDIRLVYDEFKSSLINVII